MGLRSGGVAVVGAAAAGSLIWQTVGRLHLTIIVKARYRLDSGKRMQLIEPAPLLPHDEHHDGSPTSSVHRPSDAVPYLRQAEVLFTGTSSACP
jgi:hypothetical protein